MIPAAPFVGPVVRDLADLVGKTRQIPLSCHFRVIRIDPGGASQTAFTIEYQANTVSEDALSDSLFLPPADYKKVAPPHNSSSFDPALFKGTPSGASPAGDHPH
jgi:hypothetical protein